MEIKQQSIHRASIIFVIYTINVDAKAFSLSQLINHPRNSLYFILIWQLPQCRCIHGCSAMHLPELRFVVVNSIVRSTTLHTRCKKQTIFSISAAVEDFFCAALICICFSRSKTNALTLQNTLGKGNEVIHTSRIISIYSPPLSIRQCRTAVRSIPYDV